MKKKTLVDLSECTYLENKMREKNDWVGNVQIFHNSIRSEDSDCSILSRRCFNLIFNERVNVSSIRNDKLSKINFFLFIK